MHSIHNVAQANTLIKPIHKDKKGRLKTFNYIVANPPFKLDFSDFRDELDKRENGDRFFAGIPKVPAKEKESMAIYLLFLQHIIFSLKPGGKAAIVVPTGFITANSGIEKKIRQKLVDNKMLRGAINMPPNIFATTGTKVSILSIVAWIVFWSWLTRLTEDQISDSESGAEIQILRNPRKKQTFSKTSLKMQRDPPVLLLQRVEIPHLLRYTGALCRANIKKL